MRELKFRIWDKQNKIFIYERDASHKRLAISLVGLVYHGGYDDVLTENDYVVQQYTGLKDCSGKDIYEGDIVSYEAGEPNRNDGSFYKSISEVKFENGAFWPRPIKEECEDSWYDYELKNICIIGNIFENPELLK